MNETSSKRSGANQGATAGREPRAGRQPRERQAKLGVGDTLQVREENDCDGFFLKAMSGGDVKAFPRRREREPGGGESQEGIGTERRLTTVDRFTDPHPEQSPEGGATGGGAGEQSSAASWRQRREGTGHRRGGLAGCGEQTPGGRTLDVAVG
jgi:hypothetical protein